MNAGIAFKVDQLIWPLFISAQAISSHNSDSITEFCDKNMPHVNEFSQSLPRNTSDLHESDF